MPGLPSLNTGDSLQLRCGSYPVLIYVIAIYSEGLEY